MPVSLPDLEMGPPGNDAAPGTVRQRWFDNEGRLIASGGRASGRFWMHWGGLATFWFGAHGNVVAEPVHRGRDDEIRDAFARGVVPVVLLARGYEALHASAVLHPSGLIIFCGTSGTGKSTIALAVSARGLRHFADDTVVYRPAASGHPQAVALPATVRVDAQAQRASGAGEAVTQAARHTTAPVHRVYLLIRDNGVGPQSPDFGRVQAVQRFERLLAHSHPFEMGTSGRRRAFFQRLLAFAAKVDVWECRFAPDLAALPALAGRIEEHASGQ